MALAASEGRWLSAVPDPYLCLAPTDVIESDHPAIRALAAALPAGDEWEVAAAAFERVRDGIAYDFAPDLTKREDWRAGVTVERGTGFCQQKAVVLVSVLRAAGIPAAPAFETLFDAKIRPPFSDMLGGQLLPWHGLALAHLGGRWVRLDASLDSRLCASRHYRKATLRRGVGAPLPLDDEGGKPHFRSVRELAAGPDLPAAAVEAVLQLEVIHGEAWKDQVRSRRGSM